MNKFLGLASLALVAGLGLAFLHPDVRDGASKLAGRLRPQPA